MTLETELNELRAELQEWRKFIIPTICETPQQCREWVEKNMYINGVSGVIIANVFKKENDELRAEVERLKEEREQWRMSSVCRELRAENDELKEENKLLRNDKWIVDWMGIDRDSVKEAMEAGND